MGSLKKQNILIAGASSGIGKEIAHQAANEGANLCLISSNAEKLNGVVKDLSTITSVVGIAIDFSNPAWHQNYTTQVAEYGPFDGLVFSVGISPTKPFKVLKQEDWTNVFQLNLFSAIQLTQLALSNVSPNANFSAVYISSVLSEVGDKGKSLYSMTKSAMVAMVKSLALEYAKKTYRFNAISPGVVNTPLSSKSIYRENEESNNLMQSKHPLGFGEVSDVANAAIYLLSDKSKWVSGTNMIVDGGYLAQ